jgi:hypothetical protein
VIRTLEAKIDETGSVELLEPIEAGRPRRALLTILDEPPSAEAQLSERHKQMKTVCFINAAGAGIAGNVKTSAETVGDFIDEQLGTDFREDAFLIRHNGEKGCVRREAELHDGDTVSVTLTIIAGECALLSEASLAADWLRPEEDAAWSHLQSAR